MNTIITMLCGVAFMCIPVGCQAQDDGWKLVWHDEFDTEGAPDKTVWHFEKGFVRNHEDQWYQEDNAYCHGGLLVFEGRAEKLPCGARTAGTGAAPGTPYAIRHHR